MIVEWNIGPEIFLALVLWNGEWEWFHIFITNGTDPCQKINIWIFLMYGGLFEWQTRIHMEVLINIK